MDKINTWNNSMYLHSINIHNKILCRDNRKLRLLHVASQQFAVNNYYIHYLKSDSVKKPNLKKNYFEFNITPHT